VAYRLTFQNSSHKNATDITFSFETSRIQNLKTKKWGVHGILCPPRLKKLGGHVPRVPHQIAPMQWRITMQKRHLCWPPTFFLGPAVPPLFHSRIATVTPVSHPLTRLIHIRPSCWTIYRSFEIILEMGTVHWIELQIQCFIEIHCFK